MWNGMPKIVATTIMIIGLVACSTSYEVRNLNEPILLDENSPFECSSDTYAAREAGADLCESFGFKQEFKYTCVAKGQSCVRIHIEEKADVPDGSPAMIFFLGLVPSTGRYLYKVAVNRTDQDGNVHGVTEEFEVVVSWGVLNSIRSLFGHLNSKEEEQLKIGSFLRDKYGLTK